MQLSISGSNSRCVHHTCTTLLISEACIYNSQPGTRTTFHFVVCLGFFFFCTDTAVLKKKKSTNHNHQGRALWKLSRFLSKNLSLLHKAVLLEGNSAFLSLRCIRSHNMCFGWSSHAGSTEHSVWYKVLAFALQSSRTRLLNKCLINSWSRLGSKYVSGA